MLKSQTQAFLIILVFSLTINFSIQDEDEDPGYVNVLTDETFDDFVKNNDFVLVKYYAPWCGHCKRMAPDYKEAAEELKDTPYKLAKVDATKETKCAENAGVGGYPTLKFFIKGEMKEFSGERTKDGIVKWVKERVEKYNDQINNKKSGEPEIDDDVYVLTDETFDNFVNTNDYVFVKFYAPWCGHCKKMAPALAKAASMALEELPHVKIAKVDATVQKETAKKVSIGGYPTLKFFYKGKPVDYEAGREAKDIIEWLSKKTKEPSTELNSIEEIEDFIKQQDISVVLFGGNELSTFKTFAVGYDHAGFGHSSYNKEIFTHFKVNKEGTVILFKNFDEKRNEIAGVYSAPTLKTFVESHSIPSLIDYEPKYERFLFKNRQPGVFLFYDKSASNADTLNDVMLDLSRRVKGRILVFRSETKEEDEKKFSEDLGVKPEMLPLIMIIDSRDNSKKYVMDMAKYKKINSNTIRKFITDWQNSNVEVFIKSEDVPEFQNGPVHVLVGKTFKSIVFDKTKDVLVEFYAPWCGHCQKLAPTYEELARTLSHNENLIIAKMDATKNEVEDVNIQGYPTIKLFRANNKKPVDYERSNDDTIDTFIEFLKKHATNPINSGLEFDDDEEDIKIDL